MPLLHCHTSANAAKVIAATLVSGASADAALTCRKVPFLISVRSHSASASASVLIQPNARSRKVVVPVRHIPEDGVIDGAQGSRRRLGAVPRSPAASAGRFNRTAPRRRTLLERAQVVSDGELPDLASHPCGRVTRESEVCTRGNTRRRYIIDDRGEVRERASDARTAD